MDGWGHTHLTSAYLDTVTLNRFNSITEFQFHLWMLTVIPIAQNSGDSFVKVPCKNLCLISFQFIFLILQKGFPCSRTQSEKRPKRKTDNPGTPWITALAYCMNFSNPRYSCKPEFLRVQLPAVQFLNTSKAMFWLLSFQFLGRKEMNMFQFSILILAFT